VESHVIEYGLTASAPIALHVSAPLGEYWKLADDTPDVGSAELEVTVTLPRTFALAAGAVRAPVGFVLSTVIVCFALSLEFPALSNTRASTWYEPSAG
jgi:hypothetical protein